MATASLYGLVTVHELSNSDSLDKDQEEVAVEMSSVGSGIKMGTISSDGLNYTVDFKSDKGVVRGLG